MTETEMSGTEMSGTGMPETGIPASDVTGITMPGTELLATLLPPDVVAVEAFTDDPDAVLFPEEEATLARSVDKRRREFTTARVCAHRALAGLGVPPAPVLRGPRGEPQWPSGVIGSITHCAGYRAAVVARSTDIVTVGIDAEPNEVLPEGVLDQIALPEEHDWLGPLMHGDPAVHWDRLLFSIKESVYKAWFPLARRWLGFEDAAITVDPLGGTFSARLLVDGPVLPGGVPPGRGQRNHDLSALPEARLPERLTGFTGRWLARNGLVITAITVPGR